MKTTSSRSIFPLWAFAVILTITADLQAQRNQVDPTFQPVPSKSPIPPPAGPSKGLVLQPDGKIIIWGGNLAVRGIAKGHIARLNSDGSIDSSFHYCSCYLNSVTEVAQQPDGKLLIAGQDGTRARVVRLNADGSIDASYNPVFPAPPNSSTGANVLHVRSEGKSYVQITQSTFGFTTRYIQRLNLDGSYDNSFTTISLGGGQSFNVAASDLVEQGGQIYLAINHFGGVGTATELRRHNMDGTSDSAWQRPTVTGAANNGLIYDIDFLVDGSMLVSGRFSSVNGFEKNNLARILPAGNLDLAFTAPAVIEGGLIEPLSSGKLLWSPRVDISGQRLLYRLNSNGTIDSTFVHPPAITLWTQTFKLDAVERIYFYGGDASFHRLNPNGDPDVSFAPGVEEFGQVHALARQADGKVIVAGRFTQMNGEPRTSIARLNSNGTLDMTFNGGLGFDQPPTKLLVQPDGKILAIGPFTNYNGSDRSGILRINSEGGIDTTFAPIVTDVRTMALQSDGRILIGGTFTSVNGVGKLYLARLIATGALDTTFNPILGCCFVNDLLVQPDSKIIIAGGFSGVDGFSRPSLARLTQAGALDPTLHATGVGTLVKVSLQPNGKYVIAGATFGGGITRRNSDGSADNTFRTILLDDAGSSTVVDSLLVDADGSFMIGGQFNFVNGARRPNFARFSPHGLPDTIFFPKGADGRVRTLIHDVSGKAYIGGDFAKIHDTVRAGVARLNVAPYRKPAPFDFDGDGRADVSVFRPSTNRWYELFSSNGTVAEETFGAAGDILAPADFDGDGTTDEAVFRPSSAQWWYRSSADGSIVLHQFGQNGDIPRPSDFDGDGKADLVLFRQGVWARIGSMNPSTALYSNFGIAGDLPLVGDFDGDGKSDMAIFRPSNGDWWYAATSAGGAFRTVHWGQNGDIPVPADYDGDGKTDYAIFRPSDGGWYIYNSADQSFTILAFGTNGDRPVAADYDGDGRADIAVFRPSTGIWYLYQTTSGFAGYQFGISTDTALPGSLIP